MARGVGAAAGGRAERTLSRRGPRQRHGTNSLGSRRPSLFDKGGEGTIYADDDGDGYGADLPPELYCEGDAPDGYVTTPYDCNDDDATVNPDGTEVCDDEDNDCNGEIDELPECD